MKKSPCDAIERCSGLSASCPSDALQPVGTICRAANGLCDAPEQCNGSSTTCPVDNVQPAGTICRGLFHFIDYFFFHLNLKFIFFFVWKQKYIAAAGSCDAPEMCNGVSSSCPNDVRLSAGTECRPSIGICDNGEVVFIWILFFWCYYCF